MRNSKRSLSVIFIGLFICLCLSTAVAQAEKVNINTASKEVLMTLKGVGEALADRIIEYREKTPFKAPEDIMNVKGVGQKVFENNKDRITVT